MESQVKKRVNKLPRLVVLSAPSGAGKTTICKALAEKNPDFKISISVTTREPRLNEKNGRDYFFLSQEEFFDKVRNNELLEFEQVHGHYYGTLKSTVQDLIQQNYIVLFDIDVNGALHIKEQFPEAILIFIQPPSLEELKRRLKERKTDDPSEIEKRLQRLPEEYRKGKLFDYTVVNDNLTTTLQKIEEIIRKHQIRVQNVPNKNI